MVPYFWIGIVYTKRAIIFKKFTVNFFTGIVHTFTMMDIFVKSCDFLSNYLFSIKSCNIYYIGIIAIQFIFIGVNEINDTRVRR